MPIAVNPEHNDLADSVRSLVARVAPSDVLHEALETPIPNPPPYWKAAAEQGLQGVHLSEAVGGQGFGILELAIVLAEFGYGAVPGPFVPSAIASALIAAHDPEAKLLNDLASGEVIAAYAIDSGLTATRQGDGLVIRGEVRAVPAAAQASVLVLPVSIDSGEEWVVLDSAAAGDRAGAQCRPAATARARARERRRGRRRPGAEQSEPHACPCADVDAAVRRGGRGVAVGDRHRIGLRQDPRAVRQADRSVPGHQAQVRGDDRGHRAGDRRGVGRRPRHRRGARKRFGRQRIRVRRRGGGDAGPRRRAALRPGLHPGARRHRVHLGARHQCLLPPRAGAGGMLRPRRRLSAAGGRHRHRTPECARWTSTSTPTPRSCARRSARKSLR